LAGGGTGAVPAGMYAVAAAAEAGRASSAAAGVAAAVRPAAAIRLRRVSGRWLPRGPGVGAVILVAFPVVVA
jgi:hypothetical protein